MIDQPILTIAIPTYNRSFYLDRILKIIQYQYSSEIELIVSDNCSIDDTPKIVDKYLKQNLPIRYFKNESNIGPDLNIAKCYYEANGKYVLVFGDDDILLPGAIENILKILKNGDFGLVFLNYYGFSKNYIKERPKIKIFNKTYQYKGLDILNIITNRIAFTSACVINTRLVDKKELIETAGTNLNHVELYLKTIKEFNSHIYIGKYLIAQQDNNSGGYGYLEVIGKNYFLCLEKYLKTYENKLMLISEIVFYKFLRSEILRIRKDKGIEVAIENWNTYIDPYYCNIPFYYVYKFLLKLPYRLAVVLNKFIGILARIHYLYILIPKEKN